MIEPYNIIPIEANQNPGIITINQIPEYDIEDYDIYDDKDFKKYIQDIEKMVRQSFEYKQFIYYLRNYMDMGKSYFFKDLSSNERSKIKIEIHHTPFDLYTIVLIVFNKRLFYNEDLSVEMVAKEVMEIHYKCMIGLVPLTQTEHELVHNKYLFIPVINENNVYTIFGRYRAFIDYYKEFMTQEMLDTIDNIEEYSRHYKNSLDDKAPLIQQNIFIDSSQVYQLPDFNKLQIAMKNRAKEIKDNGYQLPTLEDKLSNKVEIYNNKNEIEETKIDNNIIDMDIYNDIKIPFISYINNQSESIISFINKKPCPISF